MKISEPYRPCAVLTHLVGDRQHPAGGTPVRIDHPVAAIFGHALADVPADDSIVKGLRPVRIAGHQLVPDEIPGRVRSASAACRGRVCLSNVTHGSISFFDTANTVSGGN